MTDNELATAKTKIEEQGILLDEWTRERKRLQAVIDGMRSNDFLQKIDFQMLAEQKLTLIDVINTLSPVAPTTANDLEGILNLIDAIQDTAEGLGLPVVWLTEEAGDE